MVGCAYRAQWLVKNVLELSIGLREVPAEPDVHEGCDDRSYDHCDPQEPIANVESKHLAALGRRHVVVWLLRDKACDDEHVKVDDPFERKDRKIDIHQSVIGLKPLVNVHSRHHFFNLMQGKHEYSGDEKVEHVYAHAPEKFSRHRAHRKPGHREHYKNRIG